MLSITVTNSIMKTINYFLTFLFLFFAALQYNDPDPYVWIPIYLSASVLSFFAARQRFFPRIYLAVITVYLLYAAWLFFENQGVLSWFFDHEAENIVQEMNDQKPWIERTREFFGLAICVFAIGLNQWWYTTIRKSDERISKKRRRKTMAEI